MKRLITFRHPVNGHRETVSGFGLIWLWCLLFGPFYFAYKGVWTHCVVSLGACLLTDGLSWFIYPFFARGIVIMAYRRNGWIDVTAGNRLPEE